MENNINTALNSSSKPERRPEYNPRELAKEEKQRNFFKSIVVASKKAKTKEFYRKDGLEKYKEVVLNLPLGVLEEIESWSNEVKE